MSIAGTYLNCSNEKAGLIIESAGAEHLVKVLTDTAGSGTYKIRGQGTLGKETDSYKADMALSDGRRLILEVKPADDSLTAMFTYVSDLDAEGLQSVEQYKYKKVGDGSLKV